jgi:hypothetical protein
MGEPYSGDFYALKYLGRPMAHSPGSPDGAQVEAAISGRSRNVLLVARRKFDRLPAATSSRLDVVVRTASWVGCTVKGVQ